APSKDAYARAVGRNARALALALVGLGFDVPGPDFGYTQTHQVWVAPPPDADPLGWGERLLEAGIRATVVNLPSHSRPGLRLGAQELTRIGMRHYDMCAVANLLGDVIDPAAEPKALRPRTESLAAAFPHVRIDFREFPG